MSVAERVRARARGEQRAAAGVPPNTLAGLVGTDNLRSRNTWAGPNITYDNAQTHAAVFACVDLLCRIVCWEMPVRVYRGEVEIPAPSIISNPHPDPHMLAEHWRWQAMESAMLRGFFAGLVTDSSATGWPAKVELLHPDAITTQRRANEARGVDWYVSGQKTELWQAGGPLLIAPSMHVSPGQHIGSSVITHARQSIGLGLAANQFGSKFFNDDAHPTAAFVAPKDGGIVTADQAQGFKDDYRRVTASGSREPLVLWGGLTYQQLQVNPEESQFLQTIGANFAQVCSFFGVPPEMVGGSTGDSMTYANVEGSNLRLLTTTVQAWLTWWDRTLTALMPRPQSVKLVPDALLRATTKMRYETHSISLGSSKSIGWMTINEVRALEDLPPMDGGDLLLTPVNDAPAEDASGEVKDPNAAPAP